MTFYIYWNLSLHDNFILYDTNEKCQVPAIVDYISDGIQQLQQFRNFVRDRSQIEKDYAQKLENLAKKYSPSAKNAEVNMNDDADWTSADSRWIFLSLFFCC